MQSPEGAKESIGPRIVSVAPLGLWTGAIDSGPLRARPNPGRPFGPKQRNIRLLRAVVLIAILELLTAPGLLSGIVREQHVVHPTSFKTTTDRSIASTVRFSYRLYSVARQPSSNKLYRVGAQEVVVLANVGTDVGYLLTGRQLAAEHVHQLDIAGSHLQLKRVRAAPVG